ncbi:MAG: NAD(P)/FAD-dependent oxidoreductase, partial [Gammaproteobacteria bacterium]
WLAPAGPLREVVPVTTPLDVIVLGLGPAGASAAAAAAAAGLTVRAFERKAVAGQPVQCAELVPGLIGQDVADFGAARAQSVRRMTTTVAGAPPDETAPFPGHMIDRARFDAHLVDAARAAGADCRLGTRVAMIDAAAGEVVSADGTPHRARVLIGADGPRSALGRALGAVNVALVHARQLSVGLPRASDSTDIFLAPAYPGGYGWLFPKGCRAHVGIGVEAAARARLPALLATLVHQLVADGRIAPPASSDRATLSGGLIPVGGRLPAAHRRGAVLSLLAGDAAGLTNPVSGAGIHAALVSGRLAGAAAAAWLGGDTAAGADYEEELDDHFGAALARALVRRAELAAIARARVPSVAEQRAAWIAYPAYWAATPTLTGEAHA